MCTAIPLILTLCVSAYVQTIKAQTQTENTALTPVPIKKEDLSGLDLPMVALKAHPKREFFQKRLYRGQELSVYIISSETAENEFESFPIEEFVYLINGRADIEPENEDGFSFYSNDFVFVPKGYSGKWKNNGGNKYHLELSVISNKRTDATMISKVKKPILLNRELLSGIGLNKASDSTYIDDLYNGIELHIVTESEEPAEKEITGFEKEQFIHVLNGSVTITPKNAEPQVFYSGDFFILPKGFTGYWKSEGVGLFRTLRVMQSD